MPRFDLNGDPLPDDGPAQTGPAPPPAQPYGAPGYQPAPQYASPSPQYAPPVLPQAPRASTFDASKIVLGVVGLIVIIGVSGWVIAQLYPPAVPAPTSYQSYTLPELGVTIDQPAGWKVLPIDKSQGSDAVKITGGVVFKNGTAMIEVAEGTPIDPDATSVVGIAQIANSLSNSPADMAASRYRRLARNPLWGYHTGHEDYYSENEKAFRFFKRENFAADRPLWGIGGPIQGYFVTEANHDICVAVVCECRQSDWKTLQLAFDHVIDSIDSTTFTKDPFNTPSSPSIPQIPTGTGAL